MKSITKTFYIVSVYIKLMVTGHTRISGKEKFSKESHNDFICGTIVLDTNEYLPQNYSNTGRSSSECFLGEFY